MTITVIGNCKRRDTLYSYLYVKNIRSIDGGNTMTAVQYSRLCLIESNRC